MSGKKVFLVEADLLEFGGTDVGSHDITEVVGVAETMEGAQRLKREYDEGKGKNHWPGTPVCEITEINLFP